MKTLYDRMKNAGACFVPDGDGLKVRALGPLPVDLVIDLRAVRGDLLEAYRERAAIMEHDGKMSKAVAQASAARDVLRTLEGIRA